MDGRLEEGVVLGDRVQTPEVNVSLNSLHFECCSASVGILTDAGRCRAGWLQQRPCPAGAAATLIRAPNMVKLPKHFGKHFLRKLF